MTNLVYPKFREAIAKGLVNCATADWRAAFVMTNSSVLADVGAEFVSSFVTLDEFNGAGYARKAMTGEAVNVDLTNVRVELDADDIDFGALSPGTRPIKGVLLFVWGGSDATSRPAVWIDQTASPGPAFPYAPTGAVVKLKLDAEGFSWL